MDKITIKDVAQKARVAISTVSLVINQKGSVSEKTKQEVLTAMRELNYRPNRAAQGLAGKLKGNIGFILSEDHFTRSEPFYTHIFIGSELEARKHNVYVLLTVVGPTFRGKNDAPRFLLDRIVDGIIIAGRVPYPLISYIQKYDIPLVLIDFQPETGPAQVVQIDNVEGGRQAVNHLIQRGYKKIVYIAGDIDHPSIYGRFEGYRKALQENQLSFSQSMLITSKPDSTFQFGYEAAGELLKSDIQFDAVFAANDALALGCLRCFTEKQIKVPDEIAIVGFDDVPATAHAHPPLTTNRVNKEEMGILAMQSLMSIIQTGKQLNTKILVPSTLIVRGSS